MTLQQDNNNIDDSKLTVIGEITETLPNATFRVKLESGIVVLGYLSGKMRKNFIKVVNGDLVEIELSTYDPTKGRITRRLSPKDIQRLGP